MEAYIVGTKSSLIVSPDKEPEKIHYTIEEASAYKEYIENAFTVPLIIRKGTFEEVKPVHIQPKCRKNKLRLK